MTRPDYEVAIIGAGPGGIAAAHLLRQKGIEDFVIVEGGDDFGGTWRDNHYPGLAVDQQSATLSDAERGDHVFEQGALRPTPV